MNPGPTCLFWFILCLMRLSISSVTIPRDTTRRRKPSLRDNHCVQRPSSPPPLGQNRESKAPHPGCKVRKFHKCIYKLSLTLFEMKSFVVSTNKTVFSMRRLIITIYIIWRSPDSNYGRVKLYMIHINVC